MPSLLLSPVFPGWPAESADGGLRRFVAISLLAHGLALSVHSDFWPLFPVDRSIQPISVRLAPVRRPSELAPSPQPDPRPSAVSKPSRRPERQAGPSETSAGPPVHTASRPDTLAMIERGKADIDAASRRQMLDPMFAPAVLQAATATPLDQATARRELRIERLDSHLIRVTTASGQRYCLQALPEAATRDIPTPVLAIPMNCP